MMYERKTFSVPAVSKPPKDCRHGWLDPRGYCVMCGTFADETIPYIIAANGYHFEGRAVVEDAKA